MEYMYFGYYRLKQLQIDKDNKINVNTNCIIDKTLEYRNKIQSNTKTNNDKNNNLINNDERDNNERNNSLSSSDSNENSNNNE
jgi:hypothetical protein